MENSSVEFMMYFGHLLYCERPPSQSLKGQKLFQVFNTLWSWSVDECVCISFVSKLGGTNESQRMFEHKLSWVIFKGKRLNVAWWTLCDLMQGHYFLLLLPCKCCCTWKGLWLPINFMDHQCESGFHHQPYWGNTAICSLDGECMALSKTTDRIQEVGCHRHALYVN